MDYLLLVLLVAGVFYALIPGAGAFYVRSRWRRFRRRIIHSSLFPIAEYRHLQARHDGFVGNLRFYGDLEAIEGDQRVWLRSESTSVAVDLNRASVYWLPSFAATHKEGREELNEETLPDEMPSEISWHRLFSLPEGTQVLVSGPLYRFRGRGIFQSTKELPVTVVLYDGARESILRRAIWAGRHRNEYWNPFTPASVSVGSFALLILAYLLLRTPELRVLAVVSLTLSVFPLTPLLPPGLALFFLYRRWWKRARFLRAERDMVLLPLRHFRHFTGEEARLTASLPNGEEVVAERCEDEDSSLLRLGTGKIRRVTRLRYARRNGTSWYLFGGPGGHDRQDGSAGEGRSLGALVQPRDPMVEVVMIPGNPLRLSRECSLQARRFELLSGAALSAGLLVNLYLVFWLVSSLIR